LANLVSESEDYNSPDHITQPDLSVICSKDQISKNGCYGAPTMIIEVLPPSTALKEGSSTYIRSMGCRSIGLSIPVIERFMYMRFREAVSKYAICIRSRKRSNPSYLKSWRCPCTGCSVWS